MAVGVDQAGDHGLARECDAFGAGRHGHARRRSDRDDLAVAHDDRGVVDRRGRRAVHDARAGERFDGW
jgi:hypothetical protein